MAVKKVKVKGGEALAADMPGGYTKVVKPDGSHVILSPEKRNVSKFPITRLKK